MAMAEGEGLDRPRRRVLIAMDGSDHSFFAFQWYMQCVHMDGIEVIVAHSGHVTRHKHFQIRFIKNWNRRHLEVLVAHCPDYSTLRHAPMMSSDPAMVSRLIQQQEDEVNAIVAKVKEALAQYKVRCRLLRLDGEAGHAIVKAAEAEGVTCIVTGTRGQGSVKRALLGSVSDYVLHHAHVPVLVCRHGPDDVSSDATPHGSSDVSPQHTSTS